MDPLTLALLGAGANIGGSLIGEAASAGDRRSQRDATSRALEALTGVPSLELGDLQLQRYELAGKLTPEQEQEILMGPSRMEKVSTDPRLAQAQMNALKQLQDLSVTGLTAEERFAARQLQEDAARQARAAEAATMQEMAMRGRGGAGAELAARLSSGQAAAQLQSEASQRTAAQAQARALQAMSQAGTLGGSIRQQDFGEKSDVAKAADAIEQFNIQNRVGVQQRNVQGRNLAQEANLRAQQDIMNRNVGLQHAEERFRKVEKPTTLHEDAVGRATRLAQAEGTRAKLHGEESKRRAELWQGLGKSVGGGLSSMAGSGSGKVS